ncbi:MAG: AgmX/PglI C-terminal domain-containing protein [Myxococcota bacterium]
MNKAINISVSREGELLMSERMDRDVIKIGRLASAHVKLDEPTVSRIHAVLEYSGGAFHLIDMGSLEGTKVNGEKVSKQRVSLSDVIEVGPYEIRLADAAAAQAMPPPVPADETHETVVMRKNIPPAATTVASAGLPNHLPGPKRGSVSRPRSSGITVTAVPPVTDPLPNGASELYPRPPPPRDRLGGPNHSGHAQSSSAVPHAPDRSNGPRTPGRPLLRSRPVTENNPAAAAGTAMVSELSMDGLEALSSVQTGPVHRGEALQIEPAWNGQSAQSPSHSVESADELIAEIAPTADIPVDVNPVHAPTLPGSGGRPEAPVSGGRLQAPVSATAPVSAWGRVPSNLASDQVREEDRSLEVKAIWGDDTVLDTVTVHDAATVTAGDATTVKGWGPFQKIQRCDLEIPSRGLPESSFVLARAVGTAGGTYDLQWPKQLPGRLVGADGSVVFLDELAARGVLEEGETAEFHRYALRPAETLTLEHGPIRIQLRYVRRTPVVPLPWSETINYNWLNTFLLVFFGHVMAVASFLATPQTPPNFEEELQRTVNRFAQIKLTPEQRRKQSSLLADLKKGKQMERAKGDEGKAGRNDPKAPRERKRRAVKGDPNEREQAQAILDKLLGADMKGAVASAMGTGGIGGELKSALGGVTGRQVGDSQGLGGLGTRGSGPGGGGLNMTGVGLGALGTAGRGGGGTGEYGQSAASLGRKKDRDIDIAIGRTIVRGSLPKELIRRVINQHMAQIRYCYEKELTRSPGIFGRVSTRFTIGPNGLVQDAMVPSSTLGNTTVEQCIVSKIKTWKFPKPKGGGVVIVNYPFVLKTSG